MKYLALGLAILAAPVTAWATPTIADASFETPNAMGSFVYNPTGTAWTFAGNSGVAGGTFFSTTPPDGSQAAFIQTAPFRDVQGDISQSVSGLISGENYAVNFYAAQRSYYPADPITVSFGGTGLGTFTPASLNFVQLTTASFTASSTSGVLDFRGAQAITNSDDLDSAIDLVSFVDLGSSTSTGGVSVPEPASLAIFGMGLLGLGLGVQKMRRRAG